MAQLNSYVSKDLLDALDARALQIYHSTGVSVSRSSLVAAALRDFLFSDCHLKKTKDLNSDNTASDNIAQEQK